MQARLVLKSDIVRDRQESRIFFIRLTKNLRGAGVSFNTTEEMDVHYAFSFMGNGRFF